MRESMWGVFIIVLGAVGIIAINLFQNLTVTNDQTYFLMKETTKAAMGDAVDFSYYKSTGKYRIVESKFVENLTRRFAESAVLSRDYNIVIHDVVEEPPKVSLSILTNAQDNHDNRYDIFQKIDAIYEAQYKIGDLFDTKYFEDEETIIGKPGTDREKLPYEDGKCPNANSGIDECISGDLQFLGWGNLPLNFDDQICYEFLPRLGPVNRDATYKECLCGKWEAPETVVITANPVFFPVNKIIKERAEYTWNFKKDGPVNDIDTTVKSTVLGQSCVVSLGFGLCPPSGLNIKIGEVKRMFANYVPEDAINRNLTWSKTTNVISLVPQNFSIRYPNKDYADITGLVEGTSVITVKSTNNVVSPPCNVTVIDTSKINCPPKPTILKGDSFRASLEGVPAGVKVTYTLQDVSFGSIANNIITTSKVGQTNYIATIDGISPPYICRFDVFEPPVLQSCNNVKLPNGVNSEQASYTGVKASDIRSYSVSNTNYITINSSGRISVVKRGSDTMFLTYETVLNSGKRLNCTVELAGTIPPEIDGCTVGTVKILYNQIDTSNIKSVCKQHLEQFPISSRTYLTQFSSIKVPVDVCGKKGPIVGCKGSTTREVLFVPATNTDIIGNKATLSFNVTYDYYGWQDSSLKCDKVKNQADQNLEVLEYNSINSTSPMCMQVTEDDFDGVLWQSLDVPTEAVLGVGTYNIEHKFTGPLGSKSICSKKGPGELKEVGSGIYLYYPPETYSSDRVSITCYISTDPSNTKVGSFPLVKPICDFYMYGDTTSVVSNSKVEKTFKLGYNGNLTITNNLADWSKIGNAVSGTSSTLSDEFRVKADTPNSGKVTINAIRQAQGGCTATRVDPMTFNVCSYSDAIYSCEDDSVYNTLLGNICFNTTLGTKPLCTIASNGKCYYDAKQTVTPGGCVNSTLVYIDETNFICSTGTRSKVCPGTILNGGKCYSKVTEKTTCQKNHSTYWPYFISGVDCYYSIVSYKCPIVNKVQTVEDMQGKCHITVLSTPSVTNYSCLKEDLPQTPDSNNKCTKTNPCGENEILGPNNMCYPESAILYADVACK